MRTFCLILIVVLLALALLDIVSIAGLAWWAGP